VKLVGKLRRVGKASRLGWHLLHGAATVVRVYPRASLRSRLALKKRWSRRLLRILGIRVEVSGRVGQRSLIVANHVSWVDIFVLNATFPTAFVAKAEVRRWPFFGWLAAKTDTLFIERGKGRQAQQMSAVMAGLLGEERRVAFFPEGTTTDGSKVLAFHAALFQPAIEAGAHVQPVAIRYVDAAGRPSTEVAYAGDTSFLSSLATILSLNEIRVAVHCTPSIDASGIDRRRLASESRDRIVAALDDVR
jgi:1-acyl-sn-glycerol-3-phosphate acyltransferase